MLVLRHLTGDLPATATRAMAYRSAANTLLLTGDRSVLCSHRGATDSHLIAVAVRQGGRLVRCDTTPADSAPAGVVEFR